MTENTIGKKEKPVFVTTVTRTQIPPTGTDKEDKGQRSSRKAEGATSQI